jgi:hypothetical protein
MISKAPKLSLNGMWKVPNRLIAHVMTSKHSSTSEVEKTKMVEPRSLGGTVGKIFGQGLCLSYWKQSKDKWRDFYVISW